MAAVLINNMPNAKMPRGRAPLSSQNVMPPSVSAELNGVACAAVRSAACRSMSAPTSANRKKRFPIALRG